jgi:hypothetical protein
MGRGIQQSENQVAAIVGKFTVSRAHDLARASTQADGAPCKISYRANGRRRVENLRDERDLP